MNADVLLARCRQSLGPYGLRVEQRNDGWYATWAFPIDERRVHGGEYGQNIVNAHLMLDNAFPGCPRCGANSFAMCVRCARLSCWMAGDRQWYCQWPLCDSSGSPAGDITSFAQHGDV